MGLLNRKDLLKRDNLKTEKVDLGNDEFVYVREMTGHERDLFERSLLEEVKDENGTIQYERAEDDFRAKFAVVTLCDENGTLLLSPGDYKILSSNMSAHKLSKIADMAQKLNKVTPKEKDELLKNSEAGQAGNSSLNSVKN